MSGAGCKFGRYQIKGHRGMGSIAAICRANDPQFQRDVAIKVLSRQAMYAFAFHSSRGDFYAAVRPIYY